MADTQQTINYLDDAREAAKDAAYAWERDRDENAQTLALLSIANALVALTELLDSMVKYGIITSTN